MRILEIQDVFHPDAGYQENIISKYFVRRGHQVEILTATLDKIPDFLVGFFGKDNIETLDKNYTSKYGAKIVRIPISRYLSGRSIFNKKALVESIRTFNPDVLFIHENSSYVAIWYLLNYRKFKIPLVLDCHMLDMASKNKFRQIFYHWYRFRITPIIKKYQIPVIRIQDDEFVWNRLGIPLSQSPFISVGSDTSLFYPNEEVKRSFRKKMSIPDNAVVFIYAGKLDESKGGLLLAKSIEKQIESTKQTVFLIIGNTVGEYGKKVEESFNNSRNKIFRFPTQKYENLAEFYQASDFAIFPRQCSLSFYDVQACGLPVIFEDNAINNGRGKFNNALIFTSGNIRALKDRLSQAADMSRNDYKVMSEASVSYVKNGFDYAKISDSYLEICEDVWKRRKK